MFSPYDALCMQLALEQAQAALTAGDFAVGAVLTVDGEIWGAARNALFSDARTTAHVEHTVLAQLSHRLRAKRLAESAAHICLYTTLEPCLMCLGIAVLHRVSRIVIACPDPSAGTIALDVQSLGSMYRHWWPTCETGLYRIEACQLIIASLRKTPFPAWHALLPAYEQVLAQWQSGHAEV